VAWALVFLLLVARAGALLAMDMSGTDAAMGRGTHAAMHPGRDMDMNDERIYAHALLNELEGRPGAGATPFRWEGEGWIGTDTNRLWLKSEGLAVVGRVEEGDHELLYGRPISSYFDLQGGLRYDLDSLTGRGWAAVGLEGLAPYWFEVSATLYVSDAWHFAAKLETSYDELVTQRLILQPLIELNAYSRPDRARQTGSGLADTDIGLRLRYEISRKFAPYIGVVYQRTSGPYSYSDALDSARSGTWRVAAGVRTWL